MQDDTLKKIEMKSDETLYILGRGTVKVFRNEYPSSFKVDDEAIIDDKKYIIRGVEGRSGATGELRGVGLIVREIKETPKHEVWILWGAMVEEESKPVHYTFDTIEELNAFLFGVYECDGWMEYRQFDDMEEFNEWHEKTWGLTDG